MSEYKIYGYIIEQRMVWYRYFKDNVEHRQDILFPTWGIRHNRKVYDSLDLAEKALEQITKAYPNIVEQWEYRIKPLYEI
jgi:hypothetical protein